MYSLIWQSVMWRPGKLWFLIGVKNPLPIRPAAPASQRAPFAALRRSPDSRLQSGYALLSSRIRRHFLILIDVLFSSYSPRSTGFSARAITVLYGRGEQHETPSAYRPPEKLPVDPAGDLIPLPLGD